MGKVTYLGVTFVMFAFIVGLGVGFILGDSNSKTSSTLDCPDVNLSCPSCPACIMPECPAIKDCTPIYKSCVDENTAEEDAELYEDQTGLKVYKMQSSRDCEDFLMGSYLRPDKQIVSYANIDNGCVLYYVIKPEA